MPLEVSTLAILVVHLVESRRTMPQKMGNITPSPSASALLFLVRIFPFTKTNVEAPPFGRGYLLFPLVRDCVLVVLCDNVQLCFINQFKEGMAL